MHINHDHVCGHHHKHSHTHAHEHEQAHHHSHKPMEELLALMKYMAGHNAAHAKELANLAVKLDEAGSHASYNKVMDAVACFNQGNRMLEEVLKELGKEQGSLPAMEELEQILREHAQRYPKMQPTDAVKLIYQNEFGGGHLIRDETACLEYLRREYISIEKDNSVPLYEEIGNGIIRVNLAALQESDLEKLGQDFIRSAAAHKGNMGSFLRKLSTLEHLTEMGIFSFGPTELKDYLAEYKGTNCPMVSHSPEYRSNYHPAYRVISAKYYLPL